MKKYYKMVSMGLVVSVLVSNGAFAAGVIKDETVYVNMKADGGIDNIIVSDWLHNDAGNIKINDKTDLTDLKNIDTNKVLDVKDGKVNWNLEDGDVYYQGYCKKELPVNVKITYWLDGKEINPNDLVGKSGAVRIKIDYENNLKKDGLYVPFAVITAMTLENSNFKNVKVAGAEVMNEGLKQVVTGIHFPGLKENVAEVSDKLALEESIEITAIAEKFEMLPIVFTVTSKVPDIDLDFNSNSFGEIKDKVELLKESTQKLYDATQKIQAGQTELKDKEVLLKDAATKLNAAILDIEKGSTNLMKGADEFNKGLNQYFEGTKKLIAGTTQYGAAAGELSGKIKEVSEKNQQLSEAVLQYSTQMEKGIDGLGKLTEGSKQIDAGVKDLSTAIQQIEAALAKTNNPELSAALKQVSAGSKALNAKTKEFTAGMESLNAGMSKGKAGATQLKANATKLNEAGKLLVENSLKLDASGKALKAGSEQIGQETISKILMGAENLFMGATKLNGGVHQYAQSMNQYSQGMVKLDDGIAKLGSGVEEYSSKMGEYNDTIQKMGIDGADAIPDISNIKSKIETMKDIASEYNNYSGISEDMDGEVKFIMKTEDLKVKKEAEVAKVETKEHKSFIEWFKGLFS